GADAEIVSYDGNTDSMRETETGKVDACVQDTPIAAFYLPRFPALRRVGEPIEKGYYVIYAKKGETALVPAINEALVLMVHGGELERIDRKYGIWDERQAELSLIADSGKFFGLAKAVGAEVKRGEVPAEESVNTSVRKRGWEIVREYGWILLQS